MQIDIKICKNVRRKKLFFTNGSRLPTTVWETQIVLDANNFLPKDKRTKIVLHMHLVLFILHNIKVQIYIIPDFFGK